MALITSAQSGNFNQTTTWTGGVIPGVGDEARASTGHTVTINVNTTCDEISNAGTGKFVINDGITLTANVTNKTASQNQLGLLNFNANAPASCSIIGNLTGATAQNGQAVVNSGNGTINITGNCFGSGPYSYAVQNSSTGVINITGNVTAGSNTSFAYGCTNSSTGTINVTGNVTANGSVGAVNNSTGTLSVIGMIQASQSSAGVTGSNVFQQTILSGPFLTETVRGVAPVYCAAWRWNASPSNSTYMEVMTNDLLVKRNLVTADNITGMPAASDVKSGIAYGPTSELTGTFSQTVTPSTADIATAVWSAASRTITEGGITAADVWNAATRTITGGTVTTLTNAPSVPTPSQIASQVRTELGTELGRIDAAVSSRLAPSGTLATVTTLTNAPSVPSASTIASQVRTELTTELARIDAPISGATAPTASTVATAVRTELGTELGRIDAAITTRAATGTLATDVTAIKAKTDALNTDRLAQVSTVSTTGAQLAAALS